MKWYSTQKACVRWGSALSDSFFITNGVRQGGILSPLLFNVYMDALSSSLSNTPIGCSIGGVMVNHIMYADDLVIISPSAKGLHACWTYVLIMANPMTFYLMMARLCACICQPTPAFMLTTLPYL